MENTTMSTATLASYIRKSVIILLFTVFYLVDEFFQLVYADLFFFDKRGDSTEIGVVEIVFDDTRNRRTTILLL